MALASAVELVSALARGDFDAVIGTAESQWVDFKQAPYPVRDGRLTDNGKWNLAKDVACFANASGGLLVFGYKTHRPANTIVEEASEHTPVPKSLVDADAYAKVISDWVYPQIRGVRMIWYPPEPSEGSGVLVVEVPAQSSRDQPFFVRRAVTEAGRIFDAWSVSAREGDRCQPVPIERIHADVAVGRIAGQLPDLGDRVGDLADRLDRLLDTTAAALQQPQGTAMLAIERVSTARDPRPLRDFYAAQGGARELLSHPPQLRSGGFNLAHLGTLTVDEGAFQVGWSGTSARAEPDGSFCAVAAATPDFLGWASNANRGDAEPIKINALALVEFTYEATRLAYELAALADEPATDYVWQLSAVGMKTADVRLEPGPLRRVAWPFPAASASSDSWRQRVEPAPDIGGTAFALLERAYALFGFGRSDIPYSRDDEVLPDAILEAGRS